MDQWDVLFDIAEEMNEYPIPVVTGLPAAGAAEGEGTRPGDDYNRRAAWAEVLEPLGWAVVGASVGGKVYWRRPGKTGRAWSATTGHCHNKASGDLLYVFSSNAAPLEAERCYSKFAVYALYHHNGDFDAAAGALQAAGYGTPAAVPLKVTYTAPGAGPADGPFPRPIPAPDLKAADPKAGWLWHGYLARGSTTLFTALWKAGKTTLLAHLLRALAGEETFCGRAVAPGRTLYVTEESESKWVERRDALGLTEAAHFLIRPFRARPRLDGWRAFLDYLAALVEENRYDVLILDPLPNLWPVKDENDAVQVGDALLPLHGLPPTVATLLVHHPRKGDGQEATASRGSGALPGFVDLIVEMRRFAAADRKDRRRVLTGYSRYDETPEEVVVELTAEGYRHHGDRAAVRALDLADVIAALLPAGPPGWTWEEALEALPAGERPRRQLLVDVLQRGALLGRWQQGGEGKRGDPYRWWLDVH